MNSLEHQIEILIDESSLVDVLNAIVNIAGEKADDIRASYGDGSLAKSWDDVAKLIAATAAKISV